MRKWMMALICISVIMLLLIGCRKKSQDMHQATETESSVTTENNVKPDNTEEFTIEEGDFLIVEEEEIETDRKDQKKETVLPKPSQEETQSATEVVADDFVSDFVPGENETPGDPL